MIANSASSGLEDVAGVILAGGQSRRMGRDKAFVPFLSRPLVAHAIGRLGPQVGPLAINANGDPARFAAYGLPVLPDAPGSPQGPLAGVAAALAHAREVGCRGLVTVPCDAPFFPLDLAARLASGDRPAVAVGPAGVEPLMAYWPLAAMHEVDKALHEGRTAVHRLLDDLGAQQVTWPATRPGWWLNLNDEPSLRAAEAEAQSGKPLH